MLELPLGCSVNLPSEWLYRMSAPLSTIAAKDGMFAVAR